jgi:hypothetical protein
VLEKYVLESFQSGATEDGIFIKHHCVAGFSLDSICWRNLLWVLQLYILLLPILEDIPWPMREHSGHSDVDHTERLVCSHNCAKQAILTLAIDDPNKHHPFPTQFLAHFILRK